MDSGWAVSYLKKKINTLKSERETQLKVLSYTLFDVKMHLLELQLIVYMVADFQ